MRAARRPHAERRSETRAKVINAAIQCLAEHGYTHTTVTRIAKRSGVSWGGIQHHFGTKDAVIQAVLDHALDEFLVEVPRFTTRDDRLETRVKVLVEGAWRLLNRPGFLAFFEIVFSHRHEPSKSNPALRYRARVWTVINTVWDQLLGDLPLTQEQLATARRVAFATLGGMVIESLIWTDAPSFDQPLQILQGHLLRLLRESRRSA